MPQFINVVLIYLLISLNGCIVFWDFFAQYNQWKIYQISFNNIPDIVPACACASNISKSFLYLFGGIVLIILLWVGVNNSKFYFKIPGGYSAVNFLYMHHIHCHHDKHITSIFRDFIREILPLKALTNFSLQSKSSPAALKIFLIRYSTIFTFLNFLSNMLCSKSGSFSVRFPFYKFLNKTTGNEYLLEL